MNINKLMQQTQAMQNKMKKLEQEFNEKQFDISYNNFNLKVDVVIKGNLKIEKININDDLWKTNDLEQIETILQIAINQAISQIMKEKQKIMEQTENSLKFKKGF